MKRFNKKIILNLVFILTVVLSLQAILVHAPPPVPKVSPSISYGGVVYNGDNSYTFTYYVTSGTPVVKKWQLYSPCFKHNGPIVTVEAQDGSDPIFEPDWNMNKAKHYVEFKHESKNVYTNGLTRTYYITLQLNGYIPLPVGEVDYMLHWPSGKQVDGKIMGPICPPDFVIDELPLGTLGILIPLGAAIGLSLYNKKLLFV